MPRSTLISASPTPGLPLALAAVLALIPGPSSAQVDDPPPGIDRILLANGNVVDGEVLGLQRGKLQFDTDAMNVVSVDWEDVRRIWSDLVFEVTDVHGRLFYGSLETDPQERALLVVLDNEVVSLPFEEVVELRSLAGTFWSSTDGYIDLGINVTAANALRSVNLSGHLGYNGRIWEADLDGQTYYQSQESTSEGFTTQTETSRNTLSLEGRRNISGLWAGTTSASWESNEELRLERRNLFAVGLRYNIVRNQSLEFYTGLAGVYNVEQFTDEPSAHSGELRTTLGFDMFDLGDVDVYALAQAYVPGGFDRFRLNLDTRVAWEIINDFTIGLNLTERYDSDATQGSKRDFQYGLTVGWTWG